MNILMSLSSFLCSFEQLCELLAEHSASYQHEKMTVSSKFASNQADGYSVLIKVKILSTCKNYNLPIPTDLHVHKQFSSLKKFFLKIIIKFGQHFLKLLSCFLLAIKFSDLAKISKSFSM